VRRAILSLEFLDSWDKELKKMNQGKRGRPFESALGYTFFHLLSPVRGALRKLSSFIPELKVADYTTLWHRITEPAIEVPKVDEKVVVAVDSTGIKVTNRGEWMRKKWQEKKEEED